METKTTKNEETRASVERIAREGMGAADTFAAIAAKHGDTVAHGWVAQRHAAPASWTFPS